MTWCQVQTFTSPDSSHKMISQTTISSGHFQILWVKLTWVSGQESKKVKFARSLLLNYYWPQFPTQEFSLSWNQQGAKATRQSLKWVCKSFVTSKEVCKKGCWNLGMSSRRLFPKPICTFSWWRELTNSWNSGTGLSLHRLRWQTNPSLPSPPTWAPTPTCAWASLVCGPHANERWTNEEMPSYLPPSDTLSHLGTGAPHWGPLVTDLQKKI